MQIIKQLRRTKGINQSDLAAAIGVSLRTIQLYEKKNANIPIKNLTKIAEFFDLAIGELYLREVNEEESAYGRKKIFDAYGNIGYHLANGKFLVDVPILFEDSQAKFVKKYPNPDLIKNLIKSGFIVDQFNEAGFMAFEIIGNSMNDGTIASIPHGTLVLGKKIEEDTFLAAAKDQLVNKAMIFICEAQIVCKRFTGYNPHMKSVSCSSINNSPEYKDFDIPMREIAGIYEVVKKQL